MRLFFFIFVIVSLFGGWACRSGVTKASEHEIAYVGFYSHDVKKSKERDYSDQLHLKALQHYIDQLNRSNKNVRYHLHAYDCAFNEDTIPAIYRAIAANPNVALVIDNTWGRHIAKAREIIRENHLPVIALSADQNNPDFGPTVFLDPNDPQPLYLLKFIKEVLKQSSVGFITERDYLLHNKFEELRCAPDCWMTFQPLASLPQKVNDDTFSEKELENLLKEQLTRNLKYSQDSVILLNLHSKAGNVVMRFFKEYKDRKFTLIGLPGVTNLKSEELDSISQRGHRLISIENNNDIFPLELYLDEQQLIRYDSIGKPYLALPEKGFLETQDTFFLNSNTYKNQIRRCFDAVNILESAIQKKNTHRAALAYYIEGLHRTKISIKNQLYEFDENLILRREPTFNERSNGKNRSHHQQINVDGRPIPNLQVGLDILDIGEIDIKNNSFECSLLYWVIADSSQIQYESYIDFDKITANEARKEFIAKQYDKDDSSYVVKIYRVSGKFSCDFEAFDFPFDDHEVTIPVSALSSSNDLRIHFDYSRLLAKNKAQFKFNDWSTTPIL
jgi:hypothetical protein